MTKQLKFATIDFLPVCSNCHQVLWGETIEVKKTDPGNQIYPKRCPRCMAEFSCAAMPTTLPFYCEPLWPISVED